MMIDMQGLGIRIEPPLSQQPLWQMSRALTAGNAHKPKWQQLQHRKIICTFWQAFATPRARHSPQFVCHFKSAEVNAQPLQVVSEVQQKSAGETPTLFKINLTFSESESFYPPPLPKPPGSMTNLSSENPLGGVISSSVWPKSNTTALTRPISCFAVV